MKLPLGLVGLLSVLPTVYGHYKWPAMIVNGKVTGDYQYVRENTNNINPLLDLKSTDLRCNEGGLQSASKTGTVSVSAGSKVGFTLSNSISHIGPVLVYMAKAPGDPSQWDASGEVWFKVNEWGPDFSSGSINWPQLGVMSYEFNIPAAVPSGKYLVRIEHIGVHNAANYGGAQFFVACGQVDVVSGGSGSPGPLVAFPGAYSNDDPGIYFNNYYPPPKSYIIPGPPVWTG
ncbi:family 61 glycoside hydrolase [Purpureocillium lavendulum]|uniref:lytic cellulose monooxygenase (C4-dehydrogenating) n=1 Tax=Purpureocillium lavendulum TaxID=1247861 RepID=A0AB34FNY3_9HYPO|nr:family 61 glycoside hydrolase [Purpureocillium lavendulum]